MSDSASPSPSDAPSPNAAPPHADHSSVDGDSTEGAEPSVTPGRPWVWGITGLALGALIGGYFWWYVRTPMIDLPADGPPVRVRVFDEKWAGTVWKPAAALESWMLGREVELVAGSPFDVIPTK